MHSDSPGAFVQCLRFIFVQLIAFVLLYGFMAYTWPLNPPTVVKAYHRHCANALQWHLAVGELFIRTNWTPAEWWSSVSAAYRSHFGSLAWHFWTTIWAVAAVGVAFLYDYFTFGNETK